MQIDLQIPVFNDDPIYQAKSDLKLLLATLVASPHNSRARSIAQTKVEEAILWARQAINGG